MARIEVALAALWLACAPAAAQDGDAPGYQQTEPEKPQTFRWDDHPTVYFGRDSRVEFKARVQLDVRESDAPIGDPSTYDLARRRIGIEGRLGRIAGFELDYELADDEPWRDVYVEYRQFSAIRVQAGRFKLPVGLDENDPASQLDFVYRSRAATQLAPGRDRGVMAQGRVVRGILQYELGGFAHDGRNARIDGSDRVFGGRTVAGRLSAEPFRRSESIGRTLHVGTALSTSDVPEGFAALRGRTALDTSFYRSDYWVRGLRRRFGFEARWRPGPFSVQGEYLRVTTERRGQSVEDTDLSSLIATGWYASGTWLVTGERKSRGGDRPDHPVVRGGVGAIELAVRLEELTFGSGAQGEPPSRGPRADVVVGNADRAATFGVNWYPCRGIKLQANIIREAISDAMQTPAPTKPTVWSQVLRLQFSL